MKKLILVLIIALCSITVAHSQYLGFITCKEGFSPARNAAATAINVDTNALELIAIIASNSSVDLGMGGVIPGEIAFTGDNTGKATICTYIFIEKGKPEICYEFSAAKITLMGGQIMSLATNTYSIFDDPNYAKVAINIDEIMDSDEFVAAVSAKEEFSLQYENHWIGVITSNINYDCIQQNQTSWYFEENSTENNYYNCCSAPINDISNLYCSFTGIDENIEIPNLKIFPNPTSDNLFIEFNENEIQIDEINIYDVAGNLVLECNANATSINISTLPTKNYYVCFTIGNLKTYKPFVVSNK